MIAWAFALIKGAADKSATPQKPSKQVTETKKTAINDNSSHAYAVCDAYQSDIDKKACIDELNAEQAAQEAVEREKQSHGAWHYQVKVDEMTDVRTYIASIASDNFVNFDFPYNGPQQGTVVISSGLGGNKIIFFIEKGQILCDSYDGCSVSIRFGSRNPISFKASGSSTHESTILFLSGSKTFLDNMRVVDTIKVSVKAYEEGSNVFTFNVKGLDKDKFMPR